VAHSSPEPLRALLADYDRLVEIGIGHRTDLAGALADAGVSVLATDVESRPVPAGVRFVVDDVTRPARAHYADAEALYARRLPPELQRPVRELARSVDADCYFTTLGSDPAVVPAEPLTIREGTVYVCRRG